jgi:hypothetical protein
VWSNAHGCEENRCDEAAVEDVTKDKNFDCLISPLAAELGKRLSPLDPPPYESPLIEQRK